MTRLVDSGLPTYWASTMHSSHFAGSSWHALTYSSSPCSRFLAFSPPQDPHSGAKRQRKAAAICQMHRICICSCHPLSSSFIFDYPKPGCCQGSAVRAFFCFRSNHCELILCNGHRHPRPSRTLTLETARCDLWRREWGLVEALIDRRTKGKKNRAEIDWAPVVGFLALALALGSLHRTGLAGVLPAGSGLGHSLLRF